MFFEYKETIPGKPIAAEAKNKTGNSLACKIDCYKFKNNKAANSAGESGSTLKTE